MPARTLLALLCLTALVNAGPGMTFLRPHNQALLELAQQNTQASREQFEQRIWSCFDVQACAQTILGKHREGLEQEQRDELDAMVARLLAAELWLMLQGAREISYVSEATEGEQTTVGAQLGGRELQFVLRRGADGWRLRELHGEEGPLVANLQAQIAELSSLRDARVALQRRLDQLSAATPRFR